MKIQVWDNKAQQYIPQEDFAISGDNKLLIAYDINESILLYPRGTTTFGGYKENPEMDDYAIIFNDIVVVGEIKKEEVSL